MILLGGGLMASASPFYSDHHLLSTNPRLVDFDLQSLAGQYTSVDDFFIRDHYAAPQCSTTDTLQIDGAVKTSRKLKIEDLAHLPQKQVGAVLECAGNGTGPDALVSNGLWEGWPLADVLTLAGPLSPDAYLHITGKDGFVRSVPLSRASDGGLLVTRLNHQPLTPAHGAPWRVLFPRYYGMDSVKWIERITVSSTDLQPAGNDYLKVVREGSGKTTISPLPLLQVKSAIVSPRVGAVLRCGTIKVRGVAWSGRGKVAAVHISADKGRTWAPTTLRAQTQSEWVLWNAELQLLQPGMIELGCRATDDQGNKQPLQHDPKRLDGYGDNTVAFVRCLLVK
jgi:DMSO/TMAO reductase YedYZ molybdopterin-dependent catalytic subunit